MSNVTYQSIPVCSQLYEVPYLFPSGPESGLVFYSSLLVFTLFVLCYVLFKIRRQLQLLQKGEIRTMKDYLLPIYMIFLYFCVLIYGVKAIDIAIAYIVYRTKFQQGMPVPFAIFHAASFWTSEFWLFDLLIFFLTSNSHGTLTIRRAFWLSTLIWIANAVTIAFAIEEASLNGYINFVAVYAVQCFIGLSALIFMYCQNYPHYSVGLWSFVFLFVFECMLRFTADFLRYNQFAAFCFMNLADLISSLVSPYLIVFTLKKDSKHWSTLSDVMTTANRGSVYHTFSKKVMGHERPSMTVWSELLSQHTKILKSAKLVPIHDNRRMVGGSGQVIQAMYKGERVAVKQWRFENFTKNVVALWCKEALISSNFQHPNVVKLIGICIEPPSIKIVMEWCKHGSLRNVLTSSRPLTWKQRYQFLQDISAGMRHLHRSGLVHRDLKTLNLLVDADSHNDRFVVKICDFGSSRAVDLRNYQKLHGDNAQKKDTDERDVDDESDNKDEFNIDIKRQPLPIGGRQPLISIPDDNEISDYKIINDSDLNLNNENVTPKFKDGRLLASPMISEPLPKRPELFERLRISLGFKAKKKKGTISGESWQGSIDGMGCPDEFEQLRDELILESGQSSKTMQGKADYIDKDVSFTNALLHEVTASMSTIVGSVQFLPPEILKNIEFKNGSRQAHSIRKSIYGFSVDVYSFACVMWEILTRREIYKDQSYITIQQSVLAGKRPEVRDVDLRGCPDADFLLGLMRRCWAENPSQRPNFPQIIKLLQQKGDCFIPPSNKSKMK